MRRDARACKLPCDNDLRNLAKMCAMMCAIFGLEGRKPPDVRHDGREGLFTPLPTCRPKHGYQFIVERTQ